MIYMLCCPEGYTCCCSESETQSILNWKKNLYTSIMTKCQITSITMRKCLCELFIGFTLIYFCFVLNRTVAFNPTSKYHPSVWHAPFKSFQILFYCVADPQNCIIVPSEIKCSFKLCQSSSPVSLLSQGVSFWVFIDAGLSLHYSFSSADHIWAREDSFLIINIK